MHRPTLTGLSGLMRKRVRVKHPGGTSWGLISFSDARRGNICAAGDVYVAIPFPGARGTAASPSMAGRPSLPPPGQGGSKETAVVYAGKTCAVSLHDQPECRIGAICGMARWHQNSIGTLAADLTPCVEESAGISRMSQFAPTCWVMHWPFGRDMGSVKEHAECHAPASPECPVWTTIHAAAPSSPCLHPYGDAPYGDAL